MLQKIERTISINALPSIVWEHLTVPKLMRGWMAEAEMNLEVTTDWVVGNPILVTGLHHVQFENKGIVLQFDPQKIIQYSHLSSTSRLTDSKDNYSIITFLLSPNEKQTLLTVSVENFPTESIYKHMDFYWLGTIILLKNLIEQK